MTQTELQQLIERVENDLSNNWAVDKDDIRLLVEISKQVSNQIDFTQGRMIRVLIEDLDGKGIIDKIIERQRHAL